MATNQSTEKILNYIEKSKEPITKTDICLGCSLSSYSVKECLLLLEKFGKIEIISNGRTWLIRLKKENKRVENATITNQF